MRFAVLAILLAFPVADLYATVRFAQWSGVPLWLWLAISMMTGIILLRSERVNFRSHVVAALHGEQPMLRGVVDSGRRVLAGLLLLLPGVLSDALALMLLLLPINTGTPQAVVDGRYRRLR